VRLGTAAVIALTLALPLGACSDTSGFGQVLLFSSDVKLAAPTADSATVPSALDITQENVGRYPERISDAGQWDVALRQSGGALYLHPLPATLRRVAAGLVGPESRSFDDLDEAPSSSHYSDSTVVVQEGSSYFLKSRQVVSQFGTACVFYAKAKAKEVNAAAGTATFTVTVNETCNDRRLKED
jgi:hypothetical protein